MKHEDFSSLFPICQVRVSRLYDLYVNCPVSFYFSAPARHLPRHIIASLPASSMPLHRQCGSLAGPEQNGELPGFLADHHLHHITENARGRMSILSNDSNGTPEYFSEYMSDRIPQDMLDRKSEYMSEGMPRWGSLEEINFL